MNHYPGGAAKIADLWNVEPRKKYVKEAIGILREKFAALDSYGPAQVVEFHHSADHKERGLQRRRAYELVRHFLSMLDG